MTPHGRERGRCTIGVGMEGPVIPILRASRHIRVLADGVQKEPQAARGKWVGILGHEQDMTDAPHPNLMHEFWKRLGIGNVDVCIRFVAMPVASGDHELVPAAGQLRNALVFLPASKGIDFEGVNE